MIFGARDSSSLVEGTRRSAGWDEASLTPQKAGLRVIKIKEDEIKATFNVFPSLKERNTDFYEREIVFKLILENGNWVVDDLISSGRSARAEIQGEIKSLQQR